MLPTPLAEGASRNVVRYKVESSDVLSDMRVNVFEENSTKILWYKERFLADEEIIEHLVDNTSSSIIWTIHRPKRGWYIRLRSPSFPSDVFINLRPLPPTSPYYTDAALFFGCRTNQPSSSYFSPSTASVDSDSTITDWRRDSTMHSYPPTPPTQNTSSIIIHPPSPTSVHAKLDEIVPQLQRARARPSQISHFLLTPLVAPQPVMRQSVFARLASVLRNNVPSTSSSFTLAPIPNPVPSYSVAGTSAEHAEAPRAHPHPALPLLTFHDLTPMWTARSTTGSLEVDKDCERELGVQESFYIAVALTYLEFLSEREAYLAAAAD